MRKVSVITVNFNQPSVTEALLDSVISDSYFRQMEVIVTDNGSKNSPINLWNAKYPNITFIRSEQNLGFAGGNNLAIQAANGEYLFLVNNDTEFTPGLVEQLVNTLDANPGVGIISPKIRFFHQPDMIQYAGYTPMNYSTCRNKCIGEFEKDSGQYDHTTGPTGYIHGAAMMVRREALDKAGLMPENFFLYYEEIDWCERIKRAGFGIWVDPAALIYHKESVSVGKTSALKEYFMNRNRILFIRRNAPFFSKLLFALHFSLLVVPRNILTYLARKRPGLTIYLFKAIWWNLTHSKNSQDTGYPLNKIT